MNVFNSNGDGTYDFPVGGPSATVSNWAFEWSVNTDYDGSAPGRTIDALTYELGIDFDPGPGTQFLAWDPLTVPSTIPYAVPATTDFYDHSMGTNATANGGGVEATDNATYLANVSSLNVAQQSWRHSFFNGLDFNTILSSNPGEYTIYLAAYDATLTQVGYTEITVNVTVPDNTLSLEIANCPDDADAAAGNQIAVQLWLRNPDQLITGYQAFMAYDDTKLDYRSDLSSYDNTAFGGHIPPGAPTETVSGEIGANGSTFGGGTGASADALLATLVFDVLTECTTTSVDFDPASVFDSEISVGGTPLATTLNDTGDFYMDDTAPVILTCPADITIECDESSDPSNTGDLTDTDVSDNCTPAASIVIGYSDVVTPGACADEETIVRTWTIADSCGNTDTCVQTITVEDTTAPVLACPADVTVECDQSTDPDDVNTLLAIPFDLDPVLSATQAPGVWYTDRYAPFGFVSSFFDGDDRLLHSIDASDGSTSRPGSFSSAFYDTQGRKYDLAPGTTRMTIELYVPSAWATTDRRMAGLWGTTFDAGAAISGYPIIEFTSDNSDPRFRWFTQDTDQDDSNGYQPGWIDMGLPTGFVYDDWYTLEIVLTGSSFVGTVGDLQVTDVYTFDSVEIGNVILQGHNNAAGVTYDIYWDNFVSAQTVFATDNCDPAPVVAYSDSVAAGGCPDEETITRTWTATDACGNVATCMQIITVVDTTDPVITCPADITIECDESSAPANTGSATATDNCDAAPAVTFSDAPSLGCNGTGTIVRTWTATDACGNSADCMQTITIQDTTAPVITLCPDSITQNADAGVCTADVTWDTATATDNCSAPTIVYEIDLDDDTTIDATQAGTTYTFPTGNHRVTVRATDGCGLETTCDFTVTIDDVNTLTVTVELEGVLEVGPRCIRFIPLPGGCSSEAVDAVLTFTDHDSNPATAVRAEDAEIEVPCGAYTDLCVKDEQHTLYSTVSVTDLGTEYDADSVVVLSSGDTDNDSDVDINDVTWLIVQFGGASAAGGCPWDGVTRDADFSNNGNVGSEDYTILSANFLTFSTCACVLPINGGGENGTPDIVTGGVDFARAGATTVARNGRPLTAVPVEALPAQVAAEADLNADGIIDVNDVVLFEAMHGLPTTLSQALLAAEFDAAPKPLRRP